MAVPLSRMNDAPSDIDFWLPHIKVAGGTKITLTYASLLAKRGHRVRVFVRQTSWRERLFSRTSWKGKFRVPIMYVRDWQDACRMAAGIVIADSWQVADALRVCPTPRAKFELIQHDERLYHGNPGAVESVYRSPELKKIAIATWLKKLFAGEFGQDAALLTNTIDTKAFFPGPPRTKDGTIRILLLVHTYPWKGTREGIDMVAALKKSNPGIKLIGFGVRTKDRPDGIDEYHYNPSQKELRELYASADIFLCPSWDEGFGLPSIEAMACGAALVTYDNGGSRDYAFHEKTALVARHRDTTDLQAQLGRLVSDPALRARIADEGKRFAAGLPNWDERAQELEDILRR